MARAIRGSTLYSTFHVMSRGNRKAKIFFEQKDYRFFYRRLRHAVSNYSCYVHLFCLMPNHVHLVIETKHIPLIKVISSILGPYSSYIHNKIGRKGRLHDDRYKAKKVHNDHYMLELCHYIHMNPLKAAITDKLDAFPWSSHGCYKGHEKLDFVYVDHVNNLLDTYVGGKRPYEKYINDRESCYESLYTGFDKDGFLVSVKKSKKNNIDESDPLLMNIDIQKIVEIVSTEMAISIIRIRSHDNSLSAPLI